MIKLNEKVVLITGASGAVGTATAYKFAQAHTKSALTERSQRKLEALYPAS